MESNIYDEFYNADADTKKALLTAGIASGGALIAGLATRPRKNANELEQQCGKKPNFGKSKIDAWNKCVNKANTPIVKAPDEVAGMSKNMKIGLVITGSILVLGIIGFVIYKSRKK